MTFTFTEDEKKKLLEQFSNNFTQAHQLMAWIEDPNVPVKERYQYYDHMFHIFESLHTLLLIFPEAGITSNQVIDALNELPF